MAKKQPSSSLDLGVTEENSLVTLSDSDER